MVQEGISSSGKECLKFSSWELKFITCLARTQFSTWPHTRPSSMAFMHEVLFWVFYLIPLITLSVVCLLGISNLFNYIKRLMTGPK